jgi:hypothetical protein
MGKSEDDIADKIADRVAARLAIAMKSRWHSDKEVDEILGWRHGTVGQKRCRGDRVPESFGHGKCRRTHDDAIDTFIREMGASNGGVSP